jgi:hypothetical protein
MQPPPPMILMPCAPVRSTSRAARRISSGESQIRGAAKSP